MTVASLTTARAAISVGPSGSPVYNFNTTPTAGEFSTGVLNGDGATYNSTASLDAGVNTRAASTITRTLPTSATLPPSTFSGGFRHNNNASGLFIQSRPTTDATNAANVLLATLTNETAAAVDTITVSYTFNLFSFNANDEVPGFRVYYSLTGNAGSWQLIPGLSDNTNAGTHTATFSIGTWAQDATMYLLWADDNSGTGGTDASYTIDDFVVLPGSVTLPLSVALTSPTNGAVFAAPANVTVSASTSGSTPASSVTFYTNNVAYAVVTTPPFNAPLANLPAGTYAIHAKATNATEVAFSGTNTITVRLGVVSYSGGDLEEDFDGMTDSGTLTPIGWYVGAALPANSIYVTVGDGSAGPSGSVLGWNYGLTSDSDRALGTAPTGGDRNIVWRVQNDTSSNIVSITLLYDGEVWRNYTNEVDGGLTNFVSTDNGASWTATGFDFDQPAALRVPPPGAVNGNDPANRVADIGGNFALPNPVPPGGVLYIRWQDFNGAGVTDGGLAIDSIRFSAQFDVFQNFVRITSPTNGQAFAAGAPITINAVGAMANPITNIAFFRDGGTLIGNDATAPFSAVYSNATTGMHTLTATAQDSTGASVSTTNVVNITVNPNVPPSVTLTNPADTSFLVGANISNFVSVVDSDGTVTNVDYYVDGVFAYRDATPAKFEYCDALAGTHVISAIAYDNLGAVGSNGVTITVTNPPGVTLLLTNGATWKYLDDTTDPGATWRQLAFNDAGWSNGVAELGFGDSAQDRPERTLVRRFVGTTTNITFYFRHQIEVADPSAFGSVALRLLADDGAVVYINDVEVYRTTNMPAGPVGHTTTTDAVAPDDGAGYHWTTNLASSVLVAGTNIIAVEVHQDSATSSDVSFDLMLWGEGGAAGPALTITRLTDTTAEIAWPDSFTGYSLEYKTDLNAASWTPEPATVTQSGGYYRATVNTASGNKFWRLQKP